MTPRKSGRRGMRPNSPASRNAQTKRSSGLLHNRTAVIVLGVSFFAIVAAISRIPEFRTQSIGIGFAPGQVAREEITAQFAFKAEDLEKTKSERDKAAANVPDTYRTDTEKIDEQIRLLTERIEMLQSKQGDIDKAIQKALKNSNSRWSNADVVAKAVQEYAQTLIRDDPAFTAYPDAATLATWLFPTPESTPTREFAESDTQPQRVTKLIDPDVTPLQFAHQALLAQVAREGLRSVLSYGIIKSAQSEEPEKRVVTILRDRPGPDQKQNEDLPLAQMPTLKSAEEYLNAGIVEAARRYAEDHADTSLDQTKLRTAAFDMASPFITDTLVYDRLYTEGARERARMAVAPVMKDIGQGEMIQAKGLRISAQSHSDVNAYRTALEAQREPWGRVLAMIAGNALLTALILVGIVRSVVLLTPRRHDARHNLYLVCLVVCVTVLLGRLVSFFEPTGYIVPTAAGAILLAILLNARIAVMATFLSALLVSIQFGYDWQLLVTMCVMSVAGVLGVYRVRRRSDMTGAAIKAMLAGLIVTVALTLATGSLDIGLGVRRIMLVVLNGMACMFIIPGVLSPLERLFRITTDIQLLEYSDLNNELLSRIAIDIPATYSHSLMLGQLAEAAADSIGANGLLARVCAYYHDVGKLRRPEYFSENQHGYNVHTDLPPRLSARAIASHVAAGVEAAEEYDLPAPIRDGILEHHGTTLISFFYQQALEQNKHGGVNEQDFRYPGPRPRSRETAILMICDAVESGVRSIKNPNEERIREFIDRIITSRSADRQFDDSNLTLKELDIIKEAVTKRMTSNLHSRIAYPDKKPEKKADNVVSITGERA